MFVIKTGNVTTAEGDTLYQYDGASRLISVTQPNGETVSYTYDSHGNRASMTYPDGKTASYAYDDMNRLVSVKGVDGATTKYEYDALGRRIATDGAKEDTVYTYDEVGNLVSQTTTGAYDLALEYAYDLSGRMTQESRTENGATLTSSYIYDALGQLTGFSRSDGQSETYTYDPVGNMTAKTQNGVQTAMRYNAANQLIRSVTGGETTRYTYDANGNLVRSENAGGARSYAYNALGLLSQFTREDGYSETYSYNANRLLRTVTTSDNLTTALTWDILYGDGVVIAENRNGASTNYTYGLERISALSGNSRTEYLYDGRGSVAAELNYNKAWFTLGGGLGKSDVISKSYTPFGEQIGEAVSGFGYNGEYYNSATDMIYLRARFYEPKMNRFAQKDTLQGSATQPGSLNRYAYCRNDPVNFADYNGQRQVAAMVSDGGGGGKAKVSVPKPPFPNKPVQFSTNVNPYNTRNTTAQAQFDAKRALDFALSVAPGSAQARAAQQAYQQTMNYSAIARQTNNPYMTQLAVQSSRQGVSAANSLATNRLRANSTPVNPVSPTPGTPKTATPDSPSVSDIGNGQRYGCGEENLTSDSSVRKSLLSFLISAEETLSISYIKEVLKSNYQELVNAKHLAVVDKSAAAMHLGKLNRPTSFLLTGAILDFGTQVLWGETYASAFLKSISHIVVGVASTALVGLTALTGGAALGVAIGATIGLSLLADYAYDKYLKEKVDTYFPYSLYG